MSKEKIILGAKLLEQVCDKMGLDFDHARRIVIDIPFDGIINVYYERVGTDALLDIQMESNGITIKEVGK